MRKIFLCSALLFALQMQAKNHTIVIHGKGTQSPQKTEVSTTGGGISSDTLTVRPALDASIIYVCLKDTDGTVLDSHQCSATWNDQVTIIAPSNLPYGYFIEVRDDKGLVYKEFNQ